MPPSRAKRPTLHAPLRPIPGRPNRPSARPPAGPGRRRAGRAPSRPRGWGGWLVKWTLVSAIWTTIALLAALAWFAYDLPDIDQVAMPERRPALTLVAADGTDLARFGDLAGQAVNAADLPPHLIQAVLAIEDRRFHSHFGVDPIGIARATWTNLRAGRMVQGGSTITQQLAKNLFLTPDRTFRRKIQEMLLAFRLEATYTKNQILTAYLNRVYLGAGTYGIDAAARTYFGVPATEVNLRQAAILAGLLQAPSRFSPATAPELAEARADIVLSAMVDAGFITPQQAATAGSAPPPPRRRPGVGSGGRYFADWLADEVHDHVGFDRGDLTVTTTLDPALQRRAEAIVAEHLGRSGGEARTGQAAVVVMTPDGAVLALVGGRSYGDSQFNRATQARRQPGSAFKPIVYLAAIENGLTPDAEVLDAPITIGAWSPQNFDNRYRGRMTATEALAISANTAAVRVIDIAGIRNTIDLAHRLGISSELRRDRSLALGTSEVTLLELTAAYGAIANSGRAVWPHGFTRIADSSSRDVFRRSGNGAGEVVRPWHAWELSRMMAAVLDPAMRGTGRAARLDRPAAGKTGTSQDYRDAWFVGFTADLICGVWVGNDDRSPMNRVTGGGLPAQIWRDVMIAAHGNRPARALPGSDSLRVVASGEGPAGGRSGDPIAELLRRSEAPLPSAPPPAAGPAARPADGIGDLLRRLGTN